MLPSSSSSQLDDPVSPLSMSSARAIPRYIIVSSRWAAHEMTSSSSDSREEAVRRAWSGGDVNGAIAAVFAEYGPEIRGWLVGVFPDADDANDAFSAFTEKLWATRTRFGWRCSARTWAYTIARSAAIDHQRGQARRGRRRVPLSAPEAATLVARPRTATPASRKTANREAIARLR